MGIPFDLAWDLPKVNLQGYREIVRIREDGKVEIATTAAKSLLAAARTISHPAGIPPRLSVTINASSQPDSLEMTARARIDLTQSNVWYTYGTDDEGVYRNALAAWELYGPEEEDQQVFLPPRLRPRAVEDEKGGSAEVSFTLTRPGNYRLRVSTVDTAGRSTVLWKPFTVRSGPDRRLTFLTGSR
jgi:hypothetical protein